MRYFLDTEFIESGPNCPIYLISLGIVAEDGREFYAINSDCPLELASNWVKENVIPNLCLLDLSKQVVGSLTSLAAEVRIFCSRGGIPEFWGYYSDYDWVVFCQMFGSMVHLPKDWPQFCLDLKQLIYLLNLTGIPKQEGVEHNALNDARHLKKMYDLAKVNFRWI